MSDQVDYAARVRVGPAGWSYKDWDGIVYPAPRPRGFDPLEYLAGYFDTVEVNSTYYRPATAEAARGWAGRAAAGERAPGRFRFTAKLWERFTHHRDRAFTAAEVDEVRRGLDVLAEAGRLGAVLVQFPWSFKRDAAGREWLDDVTRAFGAGGAGYPLALEVRHASWDVPAFYRALAERGVGFVNVDQPLFARSLGPSAAATAPVGLRAAARAQRRQLVPRRRRRERALRLPVLGRRARALGGAHAGRGGRGARDVRGHQQPLPRAGGDERR
jgi:uncharacterized protein YecE (DUF72 family)